nr:hypothetical protein [Tanacetum cinerariifolium]
DIRARVAVHNNNNVVRDTLVDICYRSGISAGKELDIGLDGGVTNNYVQHICYFPRGMEDLMGIKGRRGYIAKVVTRVINTLELDVAINMSALTEDLAGIIIYSTYQAEEEPANFALMAIPSSSSSDNEVQFFSPACTKAYKQLHAQYDSQTIEFRESRLNVVSYQAALQSVDSRLVVYKQNESIFQDNIIVLANEVEARENYIITLKQKLSQAETKRDDLKLKFDKFQTSSKSLTELLANQTNGKHGLGYFSLENDSKSLSPAKPAKDLSHTNRRSAPIIEEWVSDSKDDSETTAL